MRSHRSIASGGAALSTVTIGTGDPVVFLHANVCDSRMWNAQIEGVGAGRKAVAYDRRGFGTTRYRTEDFSSVDDLMAVLEATAEGRKAVLVGCSQGGRIAIDAALRRPDVVRALFLISPTISGAPSPVHAPEIAILLKRQREAETTGSLSELNAIKTRLWLDGPLAPEGRVGGASRDLFLDMNGMAMCALPTGTERDAERAFPLLGSLALPTCVVWGDLDFPHIQERSAQVAEVMPHAVGQAIPGTAHLPSLDKPKAVTDLLTSFLASLGEGRVPTGA